MDIVDNKQKQNWIGKILCSKSDIPYILVSFH